jgi:hypothetical protein
VSVDVYIQQGAFVRRQPLGMLVIPAAIAVVALSAAPALATTQDSLALSSVTPSPGDTVTITGTWTASDTNPTDIRFVFGASLLGEATWQSLSAVPDQTACVTTAVDTGCLWRPAAVDEVITLKATFALPADLAPGAYAVSNFTDVPASNGTRTVTFSVGAPATTAPPTTAPPTTSTATEPAGAAGAAGADGGASAVPTAVPAGAAPTGSGAGAGLTPWALCASAAAAAGAAAMVSVRRGRRGAGH